MKTIVLVFLLTATQQIMAQKDTRLPYREIPQPESPYTAGSVAARMVDGLGFRYYWATEGLRPEDLAYKPSDSGRSSMETVKHIYGLSQFILQGLGVSAKTFRKADDLNFELMRKQTLSNFKQASAILKKAVDLKDLDNDRYPFWNIINGPISDALWHCGQVVLMRRASGNPFNSKVNVFSGKLDE